MSYRSFPLLVGAALLALAAPVSGQEGLAPGEVIDFASDTLTYDEQADVVTATGNVIVTREGNRLRANEVVYDRKSGLVEARGNVVVIDPGGNQAFGDRFQLTESLRDGVVDNILVVLQDGGRLAAISGRRVDGRSELNRAVYSPCAGQRRGGVPARAALADQGGQGRPRPGAQPAVLQQGLSRSARGAGPLHPALLAP